MANSFRQHTGLLSPYIDSMRINKISTYIPTGAQILDVGCGPGYLLKVLPPNCDYYGIDIAADIIQSNQKRFPTQNFTCVNVIEAKLPYDDKKFDVIIMAAFLEHVRNPKPMFKEMFRVLKDGGVVIGTTPTRMGGVVHHVLAHLKLASHDAAEEHTDFWDRDMFVEVVKNTGSQLEHYEKFQMGMNQLFVLKRISD